jgi:hypothetical protein
MKSSVNERLKRYVTENSLQGPDIYRNTKITRSNWSDYVHGTKPIPHEKLVTILENDKQYFMDLLSKKDKSSGGIVEEREKGKGKKITVPFF